MGKLSAIGELAMKCGHNLDLTPPSMTQVAEMACDRIAELEAKLSDWENSMKFALDPCDDEAHCSCVPYLQRRIKELEAKLEAAERRANEAEAKLAEVADAINPPVGTSVGDEAHQLISYISAILSGQPEVLAVQERWWCPKCGHKMYMATNGYGCPNCGHQQGEALDYHRMCCGHKDARIAEMEAKLEAAERRANWLSAERERVQQLAEEKDGLLDAVREYIENLAKPDAFESDLLDIIGYKGEGPLCPERKWKA